MNKRNILIILSLLVVVLSIIAYLLYRNNLISNVNRESGSEQFVVEPFSDGMSCKEMYNDIENDIVKANYCEVDSDCAVLVLGGWYMDFGCYHFVNKGVDQEQFFEKMTVYESKCRDTINDCASAPEASCISGKCVYVE